MTVAVVVPCRNEAAHLAALLDALAGQTRPPDTILIVDDRSTDATVAVAEAWGRAHPQVPVRVITGPGRGPGPAVNAGVRATTADVIMRFDGHSIPAPDYLDRCLAALSSSAECAVRSAKDAVRSAQDLPPETCHLKPAVVGGVWRVAPGAETAVARAIAAVVTHPLGSGGALYRHADAGGPERVVVDTVPFGTFPRALWEQLGGFDESLEANQDFDFNYRARRAGADVILDRRIVATYIARPTIGALARQYFRYGFWKLRMLRKDPRAIRVRQLPPVLLLPWIGLTLAVLIVRPGPVTGVLASLYPLLVLGGGLHLAISRAVHPVAAAAALATVHVAWSVGFWRGVLARGAMVALSLAAAALMLTPGFAQAPKPASKILYVLPYFPQYSSGSDATFAAEVADLRARFGEGTYVRVGFNRYIFGSMDRWDVDPSDRATIRSNLASTIAQVDSVVDRARTHGIPVSLSILTAIRNRYDPLQTGAEREDRRNTQWYANGDMAPGWITLSRYARKMRGRYEAYVRELGAVLANRMARYPSTLVAASGDGEVELSLDRPDPSFTPEITDYSPFAIAEFRDWIRNAGLYAPGQVYAGQGYTNAARYQGDVSPATDTNGDGRTLNGDFGTSFTTWTLRHFEWSLSDATEVDPGAISALTYNQPGFNALPGTDSSRFDAPRVRIPGQPWWEVFDRFRQEMVWHYNVDFARWITTTADAETATTVPRERWFSHQVPADYLFGFSPENPNPRLITSASPHWTGDVSPYGGLGITSFNVNLGANQFARTLAAVVPHIAQRNVRWAILEWNPALPVSNSLDVYEQEMALIEQYRPTLVVPWAWGDPFYQVRNSPFETALRAMIARIKDGPARSVSTYPLSAPLFLPPGYEGRLRDVLRTFPSRDAILDRDRARAVGREIRRWER